LFLGLSFLVEWVIDAWSRLPRVDHAIVLLILVVIGAFGFLEGVALGLALAVVLFVVSYSRTEVVKHALTGETFTSNVDRSPREREILRSAGAGVQVFELQGFLFFGTANRLLDRIRARAGDPSAPPLRSLILDFRRVSGLDSSAVLSFTKAAQLAGRQGFRIALAGVPAAARRQLERGGVEQEGQVAFFEDTDRALQWHEDRILEEAELEADATATFRERLAAEMPDEDVETLLGYVERMEVPAGQELISQGGSSGDVFFLERGRLTARLRQPDGGWTRLRTMGSGTVVGEMAMYLGIPRSASVVAEEASVLYRLPDGAIGLMEERHPRVAAGLHRFFARLLSERLADTLRSLSALLD
ncbi:MAG TPA: cyclic nucleotide-binding domain-containing protein, partial [Actinomycetota bacterium]|nr:cyclic nucleotide-binding domain-containing protein [Actinomycetota bacterium]